MNENLQMIQCFSYILHILVLSVVIGINRFNNSLYSSIYFSLTIHVFFKKKFLIISLNLVHSTDILWFSIYTSASFFVVVFWHGYYIDIIEIYLSKKEKGILVFLTILISHIDTPNNNSTSYTLFLILPDC